MMLASPQVLGRGQVLFLAVLTVSLLLLECWPEIDFSISRLFYDPVTDRFPFAHDPIFEDLLHDGVKKSMQFLQLGVVFVWALGFVWAPLKPWHRYLTFFVVCAFSSALLVGLLKELTGRACPAQLTEFGGAVVFQPWWSGSAEMPGGRCWPGGHVLNVFALLPGYFVMLRLRLTRVGLWWLSLILSLGMVLNIAQIVRGAHFLSHNLWSLWLCWTVYMIADRILLRQPKVVKLPTRVATEMVKCS